MTMPQNRMQVALNGDGAEDSDSSDELDDRADETEQQIVALTLLKQKLGVAVFSANSSIIYTHVLDNSHLNLVERLEVRERITRAAL